MIIYGEYLFLENFLTGGLLLILTAKLVGQKVGWLRLTVASVLCGAGGFSIFIGISGVLAILLRAAIALAASAVLFGTRGLLKKTAIFVSLTFLSGGAAMAFLLWQQIPAISGNGAIYMEPMTYGKLVCWGTLAFILTYWFIKLVIEKRIASITKGKVCLIINGESYLFEALVDSGNNLREPLTGRPVALIDSKGAEMLPFSRECLNGNKAGEHNQWNNWLRSRYVVIPYRAVGTGKGVLEGFRADKIEFNHKEIKGAVVGFYDGDFGEFEVLLNREVLNENIT